MKTYEAPELNVIFLSGTATLSVSSVTGGPGTDIELPGVEL